jgi:hypothetical protein
MNTVLVLICTGKDYWKYLLPSINSVKQFFKGDILVFTDHPSSLFGVTKQVNIPHVGWPIVTLMRFHTILQEENWLLQYQHVFYLDVDMLVVDYIGNDILSDGITAVAHSAFIGTKGTPEEDSRSTAYLPISFIRQYFTGCFFGGSTKAFLDMSKEISHHIDIDNEHGFIARWHDESHLNRYLYDHPPAKILGDSYNAWIRKPDTKILRIAKGIPDRPAVNGKQPPPTAHPGPRIPAITHTRQIRRSFGRRPSK